MARIDQVLVLQLRIGALQDADRVRRGGLVEDRLLQVEHHLQARVRHDHHAGVGPDLRHVDATGRKDLAQRRVVDLEDRRAAGSLPPTRRPFRYGGCMRVAQAGGIAIGQHHDAHGVHREHGAEQPVPAARRRPLAVIHDHEDHLARWHRGPCRPSAFGVPPRIDAGPPTSLSGAGPAQEPRVRREIGVHVLAARHEPDVRRRRVKLRLDDFVALEPGPVLAAGLETEGLELVRHVLRRHLETWAGRVAAHHRVVGNDVDPLLHVGGGDGGRRLLDRRGGRWHRGGRGLGGERGGGKKGEQ